ncbi:MAG: 50S ribosomal protein L25 [Planctomycetota bacterium]|jgi:large subunit ribosomal protein L25|nr:50S ribosomal protein L25 [Planctomycetota bacterium]MDP6940417.1 50S ribosomal protein L25 [Planctomycetota bacterium]
MHTLETQPRTQSGTRVALKERTAGRTPATLSGDGQDTIHFTLDTHAFEGLIRHHEKIMDLDLGDKKQRVLVKSVQWDYMGDIIQHVDFIRLVKGVAIEVTVTIEFIGQPKGLLKGELTKVMQDLEIRCIPSAVPETVSLNITDLDVDESITASEIELPEGVELACEPDALVCVIHPRREEPEEDEGAAEDLDGEDGTEPEVIGKGKSDEDQPEADE